MTTGLAEALGRRTEALCARLSPIGHERELADDVEAWARPRFAAAWANQRSLACRDQSYSPWATSNVSAVRQGLLIDS